MRINYCSKTNDTHCSLITGAVLDRRLRTVADKVILITGSNQGIGDAIVKALLTRGFKTVYLTARNEQRSRDAVEKLEAINPHYHQVEVADEKSIQGITNLNAFLLTTMQ